jgi:hypothetical protein
MSSVRLVREASGETSLIWLNIRLSSVRLVREASGERSLI